MQVAATAAAPGKHDELVPNLNNYVRGKLSKSEVLTFADCARALGESSTVTALINYLYKLQLPGRKESQWNFVQPRSSVVVKVQRSL